MPKILSLSFSIEKRKMNISYNWLKDYLKNIKNPEELSLILTNIGLEVESLETQQSIPGGLEGVVVGEVLSCEQHPNADRLKVTKVDVGQGEPLSIVCGAPNVEKGQKVIVATVGTVLYPIEGDSFKIKKSKLRGELSEGMICAEDEIGIGKSHEGIIVLPADTEVGLPAKDHYELEEDGVFTIGLTPNRSDATSHYGVARDVSAYNRTALPLEKIEIPAVTGKEIEIQVDIKEPSLAPRYAGIVLSDVKVEESPDWLKDRLNMIGVRPINNVVDITNFILHDLGQPLHAFDIEKIAGKKVLVRKAEKEEKFTTLDEVERTLSEDDLVIADEEKVMCIAGVFGGSYSGVTEETTSIFLESAYFDAVSIRKTSRRHGLKTDSSFRFERGTDPDMPVYALQKAVNMLVEIAGAKVSSEIYDAYPTPVARKEVSLSLKKTAALIGKEIPKKEIVEILEALEIHVEDKGEVLELSIPPYRVDVLRDVDVIEEILRIYGYNEIELDTKIKASLKPSSKPDKEAVTNQISDFLIGNGFREILSNSLTREDYLDTPEEAVKMMNPLSSDLNVMRQNLLFSALTALDYNIKRQQADLKFFEWGKTYFKKEKGYKEENHLSLVLTGKWKGQRWSEKPQEVSFYQLKGLVDTVLKRLNIVGFQSKEVESSHFAYGLEYHRGPQSLVTFGKVSAASLAKADIETEVFYADFYWDAILNALPKKGITFTEIPKFPVVHRDLALLIDESVQFQDLKTIAFKTEKKLLKEVEIFDVYKGDKLPKGKKSYALSFTLLDEEKTLTDTQIDSIINKFITNFGKEVGAEVR